MKVLSESERIKLAHDHKFYSPATNTYCLGKSLQEAAEIIRMILNSSGNPEPHICPLVKG